MLNPVSRIAAITAFMFLGFAAPSAAQNTPFGEVMGGYQVHPEGHLWATGWTVSGVLNYNDRLGLVFEWGTSQTSHTYTRRDEVRRFEEPDRWRWGGTEWPRVRRDSTLSFRGGGLRYRWPTARRIRPFAQILLGVAVEDWEDTPPKPRPEYILVCTPEDCIPEPNNGPDEHDHSVDLGALWPGIGIDIQLADRMALRFQADLLMALRIGHREVFAPRFVGGVAYNFGQAR